jgi:hypothetical protein
MFSWCALFLSHAFFARMLTFDPSAQVFIHFHEFELQFMF